MLSLNPAEKLLALIAKGLQEHAIASTENQLGDRSSYIGMSDIAMMQVCPRLAILRKVDPKNDEEVTTENYVRILKKQLILQRGHWLEDGIANALYANNFKIIPQLELSIMLGENEDVPVKVHFDFIMVTANSIRILELKSTATLPKTASVAYETQVKGQVSLLKKYADKACFNLKSEHGLILYENLTFLEICKAYLGIQPSLDDIQAWLLCVSMNEAKSFGPYLTTNFAVDLCNHSAQMAWQYMEDYRNDSSCTIPHAHGFCILCSCCEQAKDCPKFESEEYNEYEQTFEELENLKEQKESLCEKISTIEQSIKQSFFNTDLKGKWLGAGNFKFRVSEQSGRRSLNKELLLAELLQFMDEDSAYTLISNSETESAPSARLYVTVVN